MKNIESISSRSERTEYTGQLNDFQQLGVLLEHRRKAVYEFDSFNNHQNFLYKRALFGLKMYSQEELDVMHPEKINRVKRVYLKAQRILNVYKQEIVNRQTNELFSVLFPNSKITKQLVNEFTITDSKFRNTIPFKDLGVSKSDIVNKLIECKVLPSNFHNLEPKEA